MALSATGGPLQNPLRNKEVSVETVAAQVQAIVSDRWYWFPVRHHSGTVAKHLQTAIETRRPKLVLIEGPAEADALIPFLEDRKTRPPVAIYSCFEDNDNQFGLAGIRSPIAEVAPRWACWFPFVEYSPELIAIRTAQKVGARAHFIDLPHYARIASEIAPANLAPDRAPAESHKLDSDQQASDQPSSDSTTGEDRSWQSERLIADSSFYQALAAAGGYKSWDEGWDALFECRHFGDFETFRLEMLGFCSAARLTSPPPPPRDNTLDRERFMLHSIRQHIAAAGVQDSDVMIVCGGFHVFLDRDDVVPPPTIPSGTVYTTVVPYTNFRISNLSGYGAGNRAPQFYQLNWDAITGKVSNPKGHYIVSVLQSARRLGENLSSADAISVAQHARMLASLRGRSEAILDDLHDALITCCCKGNPHEQGRRLQQAIDQVDIGTKVGKVCDGVPRLPIVADFYRQLENFDLGRLVAQELREILEIDKRKPQDFAISALLHRIRFIEVPFCQPRGEQTAEFASGLIFRERWQTKWGPEVEAKLIEKNLLGDSIEAAAINQLKQQIVSHEGEASAVCKMLVDAMRMDLPDLVEQVFNLAVAAIDQESRFVSLAEAVSTLLVLDRYATHHEMKRARIAEMADRAFARACFAMLDIVAAPDDQLPAIVAGLTTLADIVLRENADTKSETFAQYISVALGATELPMLKGALLGLSVEIRLQPNSVITDEINAFASSAADQMVGAGDFIHGVISVSRASLMAGATELVDAIDELLRAAEWEVFVTMLPKIRAGMEMLHARHRDSIAARVAEKYGLSESKPLQELQVSLATATAIAELDRQVAAIMSKWSFTK